MGLLMAKKLWQYIESDHKAEDINDQQAKGFIWINIEHQQRSHVPAGSNARQTWQALCAKHEQVGPQVIANCIFGITALRYVDGTKMEDHLAKLKDYFTRLDAVNCQLPETVKAVFILASLSSTWTVFKQTQTAAASNSNPLTVSNVCLAILQERDRRVNEEHAAQSLMDSASALATTQTSTPRPGKSTRRQDRSHLICTWCGKPRHEEKECFSKRDGKPRTYQGPQANIAIEDPTGDSRVISQLFPSDQLVFTATSVVPDAGTWYIDSGASNHYCHVAELINNVTPCTRPDIVSANGGRIPVIGSGSVNLIIQPTRKGQPNRRITLTDVSLAPGLATNLISVARLTAAGLDVRFSGAACVIRRHGKVIALADLVESNNLYRLRTVRAPTPIAVTPKAHPQYCLAAGDEAELPLPVLWHQRLGHIHQMAVSNLLGHNMTADVHHTISGDTARCDACVLGKHHRTPVSGKVKAGRADRPLFRLHLDICGPFSVPAHDGSLYLLQIVDDYSRYTWARTIPNKESPTILARLKEIVTLAEAMHSGHRVSVLRSDNGPELTSAAFNAWLRSRGIQRERTAVYTPHQNGVVERMNRSVVELGRTMLIAASLPTTFWGLAMDAAVYCRNRSPTTSLDDRTPYEAWCGKKPEISHMRIFGCLAFAHIRKQERTKLDPKAKACIFVGYSPDSSTYRLWDMQEDKLLESRDVYFVESQLGIKARGANGNPGTASTASILPRLNVASTSQTATPPMISMTRQTSHL